MTVDADFSIAWWCPPPVSKTPAPLPSFLTPAEEEEAAKEVGALEKVGAAASFFYREALAFAKRHPDDPRAPEFLVRYPKSPSTQRTKYWFEGRGWYPPS